MRHALQDQARMNRCNASDQLILAGMIMSRHMSDTIDWSPWALIESVFLDETPLQLGNKTCVSWAAEQRIKWELPTLNCAMILNQSIRCINCYSSSTNTPNSFSILTYHKCYRNTWLQLFSYNGCPHEVKVTKTDLQLYNNKKLCKMFICN